MRRLYPFTDFRAGSVLAGTCGCGSALRMAESPRVLMTTVDPKAEGGVASFVRAIRPHFTVPTSPSESIQ